MGLRFEWDEPGDFLAALRDYRAGEEVTLAVIRGGAGNEEEIEVEPSERP
jgi:S1-C subfamily serine protease